MADEDLGLSGKDVTWEMIIDGDPIGLNGKITQFEEQPRFATITRRHVGTTDSDIDKVPQGHEGSFTYTAKGRELEDAMDLYRAARIARTPITIELTSTKRYRNGTSATHTYRDVQWEMTTTGQRDEAIEHRVTWETGKERLST